MWVRSVSECRRRVQEDGFILLLYGRWIPSSFVRRVLFRKDPGFDACGYLLWLVIFELDVSQSKEYDLQIQEGSLTDSSIYESGDAFTNLVLWY